MSGTRNRATVRKALAAALEGDLVGAGNPAQALYDYVKGDFDGQSPVIVVASAGTIAERQTFGGSSIEYYYDLLTFVLRGEVDGDYTEADADDQLDVVADAMEVWIASNQVSSGVWDGVDYVDRSTIEPVTIGGDPYWLERTPIKLTIL